MTFPAVSVIIPTYNRADIIHHTINNVLRQTYSKFELIIVDDCSTDCTRSVVESIHDKRIKYLKTPINGGCALARQFGVKFASGQLIAFLDDDDEWSETKLEEQVSYLEKYPDVDVVLSDYIEKNVDTGQYKYHSLENYSSQFKKNILTSPGPFFQCGLFRKEHLENIEDLLDQQAVPSEDLDFFINLCLKNLVFRNIPKSMFVWNHNNKSQSTNLEDEARALSYIVEKHRDLILLDAGYRTLADHYRRIARLYERIGNWELIKKFYIKALKTAPTDIKNVMYRLLILLGFKYSRLCLRLFRKLRGIPLA